MDKDKVFDKVGDIVSRRLKCRKEGVETDSHFTYDLGADSLDMVEVVCDCEKEFGVEIPLNGNEDLPDTIGELVDIIIKEKEQ